MDTSNTHDRPTEEVRSHKAQEELSGLAEGERSELGDDMLEDMAGGANLLPIRQGRPRSKMASLLN